MYACSRLLDIPGIFTADCPYPPCPRKIRSTTAFLSANNSLQASKKTRCVTLVFACIHPCMHTCIYKLYIYTHTDTHTQTQCLRQLTTNCPVLKAGFFSPMPCGTSWFHIGTGDVPGDLAKSAMAMLASLSLR